MLVSSVWFKGNHKHAYRHVSFVSTRLHMSIAEVSPQEDAGLTLVLGMRKLCRTAKLTCFDTECLSLNNTFCIQCREQTGLPELTLFLQQSCRCRTLTLCSCQNGQSLWLEGNTTDGLALNTAGSEAWISRKKWMWEWEKIWQIKVSVFLQNGMLALTTNLQHRKRSNFHTYSL